MVKSLLLGTAAGLVAVAGAQAADMPVKAAPVRSAAFTATASTTSRAPISASRSADMFVGNMPTTTVAA